MFKRCVAVVASIAAALLLGGLLTASNMGFKLLYTLYGPQPHPVVGATSGTNSLALPFVPHVGLENAEDLLADIGPNADVVNRFVAADDSFEFYTGSSGTNFALTPGEGYLVSVSSDTDYLIVGSHDPSHVVTFNAPTPGITGSSSGANLYAHPYHSVSTTAGELMDEIDAWAGAPVTVSIQRFVSAEEGLRVYSGFRGQTDFPLEPGEAYFVVVNTDTTFVPSHY